MATYSYSPLETAIDKNDDRALPLLWLFLLSCIVIDITRIIFLSLIFLQIIYSNILLIIFVIFFIIPNIVSTLKAIKLWCNNHSFYGIVSKLPFCFGHTVFFYVTSQQLLLSQHSIKSKLLSCLSQDIISYILDSMNNTDQFRYKIIAISYCVINNKHSKNIQDEEFIKYIEHQYNTYHSCKNIKLSIFDELYGHHEQNKSDSKQKKPFNRILRNMITAHFLKYIGLIFNKRYSLIGYIMNWIQMIQCFFFFFFPYLSMLALMTINDPVEISLTVFYIIGELLVICMVFKYEYPAFYNALNRNKKDPQREIDSLFISHWSADISLKCVECIYDLMFEHDTSMLLICELFGNDIGAIILDFCEYSLNEVFIGIKDYKKKWCFAHEVESWCNKTDFSNTDIVGWLRESDGYLQHNKVYKEHIIHIHSAGNKLYLGCGWINIPNNKLYAPPVLVKPVEVEERIRMTGPYFLLVYGLHISTTM